MVAKLLARGDAVRVFDLLPAAHPAVESIVGDVGNVRALQLATDGCDSVIHAAAAVPLARDADLFARVNVQGTRNVLAAARAAGVGKTVVVSSSAVYGAPTVLPVTMATLPQPLEAYGRSKRDADALALAADQPVAVVRPRTVLGPGRSGLFGLLFAWVHAGKPVPLVGDGRAVYQFVHAEDLADACIAAALQPGTGPWLVGSADPLPLGELLRQFCAVAGTGSTVVRLPDRGVRSLLRVVAALPGGVIAPYHAQLYGKPLWFDTAQTCAGLGWRPQHSDLDALLASYQAYVAAGGQAAGSVHSRPLAAGWLGLAQVGLRGILRR